MVRIEDGIVLPDGSVKMGDQILSETEWEAALSVKKQHIGDDVFPLPTDYLDETLPKMAREESLRRIHSS